MPRVLIIDDHPLIREMFESILTAEGHDVGTAANGAQGLKACREARPDAVFCDIIMPDQDGLEFIRTLRKEIPELPVIAISGTPKFRGLDCRQAAEDFGARSFIEKPFEARQILEALAAVLREGA